MTGFRYADEHRILERLDAYCHELAEPVLTQPLVEGFCYGISYEKPSTHYKKERVLRRLGTFMCRQGYTAYVCPVTSIPKRRAFVPHIFSGDELLRLFLESDRRPPHCRSTRMLTSPLLFRLIYGCGLRVSEALNLRLSDVDLKEGTLNIRQAKNAKDRRIPMAPSLLIRCQTYHIAVHGLSSPETYFFPNCTGGRLNHTTVYREFREILWNAGIPHSGHGPRIHDFRHTYCVHCLRQWVRAGKDLMTLLPYLAAYLGHTDFRGTQYYLRLTADVYPDMVDSMEVFLGSLIPKGAMTHETTN